ncbi:MAG: hypothetical protein II878_05605 [Bacteroidales bacterium]|nr:hypothetical protein [Bacteroidales bacterium]
MRIVKSILAIIILCLNFTTQAQDYNMQGFELILKPLMDEMFSAETDNERFAANEKFISNLEDALNFEKSFSYDFPTLRNISILTSPDKQFKIFTWAIMSESGEFENFGFVQSKNSKGEYVVYQLFDKSDDIIQPEFAKLNDSLWFGAVYYDLIQTKYDGNTFYVLLGWDGNDIFSRRKVIEPISFHKNTGKVTFGQNVFYKEKDRKRFIFEYSTEANFTLRYETQHYDVGNTKKAKSTLFHKAKPFEVEAPETEKRQMIFFDELEPMNSAMQGFKQNYVPSGNITGLYFENGKWRKLKQNVLPRNKKEKKDNYVPKERKSGLFPEK